MNSIQLVAVIIILSIIVILITYYFYQEHKFQKLVESNFNKAVGDALNATNNPLVIDGVHIDNNLDTKKNLYEKDKFIKEDKSSDTIDFSYLEEDLLQVDKNPQDEFEFDRIPPDSVEAFFAKLDATIFEYQFDSDLDAIFDIVYEDDFKLKYLPEISHLLQKEYEIYVFNKNGIWQPYQQNHKYTVRGIRYIVSLIDKSGVVSVSQLDNIYKDLRSYVINQQNAHVRSSDYKLSLECIQNQLKYLDKVPLDFELYLILKDSTNYTILNKFFINEGFVDQDGILSCKTSENLYPLCNLSDEFGNPFNKNNNYNLLLLKTKLHLQQDPISSIERVFDFCEKFMQSFEARILTTNKQLFVEHDYERLIKHISNYINSTKKNNIKLGGELLKRLFA